MRRITDEDVEKLGRVADELWVAYEAAAGGLVEANDREGLDMSPLVMRDTTGRYILADLLAACGQAYSAWATLYARRADTDDPDHEACASGAPCVVIPR